MIGIMLSKDDLLIALPCVEHTVKKELDVLNRRGLIGAHSGLAVMLKTKKKNAQSRVSPYNPTWLLVYHVCLWCLYFVDC